MSYIIKQSLRLHKIKNAIIYILFIALGCCSIYIWADKVKDDLRSPVQAITEKKVPMSIRELQTFLSEAGHSRYACEVDGKMGKETQRAWDNFICDRQAIKEFE